MLALRFVGQSTWSNKGQDIEKLRFLLMLLLVIAKTPGWMELSHAVNHLTHQLLVTVMLSHVVIKILPTTKRAPTLGLPALERFLTPVYWVRTIVISAQDDLGGHLLLTFISLACIIALLVFRENSQYIVFEQELHSSEVCCVEDYSKHVISSLL